MKIIWQIEPEDVSRVQSFCEQNRNHDFVRRREAINLAVRKAPITKERFWQVMVTCLLTTQQRSGPKSAVSTFAAKQPFPLRYTVCRRHCNELDAFVTRLLSRFGGLRRTKTIGREIHANWEHLETGGWQQMLAILEDVRCNPTPTAERAAVRFIDDQLVGFGPKQSRNLLQEVGLSRWEVPIDSRITKWLNAFGFPLRLTATALADRSYFEFVSDGFQRLAEACELAPCVLDAMIFTSYDQGLGEVTYGEP